MSAQVSAADLKGMSPEQIVKAQQEGRLDALLGVPSADTAPDASGGKA